MNQDSAPGANPPVPGAQKEEPELVNEEDIPEDDEGPSDDGGPPIADDAPSEKRPLRDVERE